MGTIDLWGALATATLSIVCLVLALEWLTSLRREHWGRRARVRLRKAHRAIALAVVTAAFAVTFAARGIAELRYAAQEADERAAKAAADCAAGTATGKLEGS